MPIIQLTSKDSKNRLYYKYSSLLLSFFRVAFLLIFFSFLPVLYSSSFITFTHQSQSVTVITFQSSSISLLFTRRRRRLQFQLPPLLLFQS